MHRILKLARTSLRKQTANYNRKKPKSRAKMNRKMMINERLQVTLKQI